MAKIETHKDLKVYQASFEAGMDVFKLSLIFPKEEVYSLTDQIRRSSRSVSGNLAEAWRKRKYPKSFIAKLVDCEGEAAETQVWLDYALACEYIDEKQQKPIFEKYDSILGMLVTMRVNHTKWTL